MQPEPFVSIIISSYNYGAFVRDAIESALQQSYPHVEVIIVDDGSSDDSRSIIGHYKGRINTIFKTNGGQASALNEGYRVSKGEVIIFLDSDDLLHKHAVVSAAPLFNDSIAKVHWQLQEIDAEGIPNGKMSPSLDLSSGSLVKEIVAKGPCASGGPPNSPPTSGNAWSRNFLQHVMPMPEEAYRTSPDQFLHAIAPVYGTVLAVKDVLGAYRVHGGNYSHNPIEKFATEFVGRYELTCRFVDMHLRQLGYTTDSGTWPRNTYYHRVLDAIAFIKSNVEQGQHFILLDNDEWGLGKNLDGRNRSYLVEQNGFYHGHPIDDAQAIDSLKQRVDDGAEFIFITQTADWYLGNYPDFTKYIQTHFHSLGSNDYLQGFRLI